MKHYFYNREQIENKKSSVFFLLFFGVNKNLKHEADHNSVPSSRLINNFYLGILTVVSGAGGRHAQSGVQVHRPFNSKYFRYFFRLLFLYPSFPLHFTLMLIPISNINY
jgi:hypothetical protein